MTERENSLGGGGLLSILCLLILLLLVVREQARCRHPLCWEEPRDSVDEGLEFGVVDTPLVGSLAPIRRRRGGDHTASVGERTPHDLVG